MRDAAAAAAMSDPERNPKFRRRWHEAYIPSQPSASQAATAENAVELTGRELLEQWRRERASQADEWSS